MQTMAGSRSHRRGRRTRVRPLLLLRSTHRRIDITAQEIRRRFRGAPAGDARLQTTRPAAGRAAGLPVLPGLAFVRGATRSALAALMSQPGAGRLAPEPGR